MLPADYSLFVEEFRRCPNAMWIMKPANAALDGDSGAATWTFAPGGQIGACGGYDGARVFVGTLRKELVAIDAADGAELWRYEGQGEVWATHGPRVVGDLVCSGFGGAA